MLPPAKPIIDRPVNGHVTIDRPEDGRHPRVWVGPAIAVYVWRYPLRLIHWGLVISIGALAFTGYYIHDPFIVGQTNTKFLMGTFRFVHEAFGMAFLSLLLLRIYLLFAGNRWTRWRALVPVTKLQWKQMVEVMKFYAFIRPTPVSYVGHNPMAAFSYIGIYALMAVEAVTGLTMFNWLAHNPILGFFVGWVTHLINIQNVRLIHYCLMYVFLAFGVLHVHLALLVSSAEKRGLMDSIFTGYKIVPVDELEEDDLRAIEAEHGKITHK
jgi:Ni/Fe-hydrogenase 1 B-type cytochrome subunit